jgi:TRAP-type C4-dicarboxylate transport system permease small subunit
MGFFDKLFAGFEVVSQRLVWLSGALLILSAFIVTIDVFARKIFGVSMAGSDELSGYAFGIATMLSLSFALIHRSNIRVDALYQFFPKPLRAILDVVGLALLVSFIGYMAWRGYFLLADSIAYQSRSITPLRTPLVIPQGAWFVGMAFCVVTGVSLLIASLIAVLRGDWNYVQRLLGVKSVDEQIEEETEQ